MNNIKNSLHYDTAPQLTPSNKQNRNQSGVKCLLQREQSCVIKLFSAPLHHSKLCLHSLFSFDRSSLKVLTVVNQQTKNKCFCWYCGPHLCPTWGSQTPNRGARFIRDTASKQISLPIDPDWNVISPNCFCLSLLYELAYINPATDKTVIRVNFVSIHFDRRSLKFLTNIEL